MNAPPSNPRVGLFVTCLVDLFRPKVGFAAIHLLNQAGCVVEVPGRQTCCGQPAYNSGDYDAARRTAKQVIEVFEPYDYIVGPSGSCAATMGLHYRDLFEERVPAALADSDLQAAMDRAKDGFIGKRAQAVSEYGDFEALRNSGQEIKDHTLAHLDYYLERHEAAVQRNGGQVHWARDSGEARRIILEICERVGAKNVTKGKSMVSEEIDLNHGLEQAGIAVHETDLGEYSFNWPAKHRATSSLRRCTRPRIKSPICSMPTMAAMVFTNA